MVLSTRSVAAIIAVVLCISSATGAQTVSPPAAFFGTWIWNGQRTKIDPRLEVYRCYVEVLDDLGGGNIRMRDYRIRQSGQVVKNDVTLEFGRIYERPGGATQWTITGPTTYRMGPPDQDSRTAFIVTREIIEGGRVMKHVGEGVLNGTSGIRNEQYFDKSDGPAKSGACVIE
jgi:hypothetical protein